VEYGTTAVWVKCGVEMADEIANVDAGGNIGFESVEPVDRSREFVQVWWGPVGIRIAYVLACLVVVRGGRC